MSGSDRILKDCPVDHQSAWSCAYCRGEQTRVTLNPDGTGTREADGKTEAMTLSEATMRQIFGDTVVDAVKQSKPTKATGSLVVESVDREAGVVTVGAKKGRRN